MKSSQAILCSTPSEHCSGGHLISDQHLGTTKVHQTHEDAFRCYSRYLVNVKGYTRLNSREFHKDDQPVLLIPKVSHFGGRLRRGKGDKTAKSKRLMPRKGRGVII
jgi:hypothetical protein